MTDLGIGSPPVLDGTNGTVIMTTVDGAEARIDTSPAPEVKEIRLIDVPLEELIHNWNDLCKKRDVARSHAGLWRGEVKRLNDRIGPIEEELRRRDDAAHDDDGSQLAFFSNNVDREPIDGFDPGNQGDEEEPGDDEG